MTTYDEPSAPLPPPGADGRLILAEDSNNRDSTKVSAVLLSSLAVISLLYILYYFGTGMYHRPDHGRLIYYAIEAAILCTPLSPLVALLALHPPQLQIDETGISYRAAGRNKTITWRDIQKISLKTVAVGRPLRLHHWIIISGAAKKITCTPVFGVSPIALAEFLTAEQNRLCSDQKISLQDSGQSEMSAVLVKTNRVLVRVKIIILVIFTVILGLLSLALAFIFLVAKFA